MNNYALVDQPLPMMTHKMNESKEWKINNAGLCGTLANKYYNISLTENTHSVRRLLSSAASVPGHYFPQLSQFVVAEQ